MSKSYIPRRNDIIWLDSDPTKGKEIGKYRPALVLSSVEYNKKSGLVICCPISTSIRGHITEVGINNLDIPCVAAANLIQTLSWKDRSMKFGVVADEGVLDGVLARLIPLIGGEHFFIDSN